MRVYSGDFGRAEAERLLWRAGFGPRPGDIESLAGKGLRSAVLSLTRPAGSERLEGAAPSVDGEPLAPTDAWGHDHLWWLDRMVRSNQPLVERMTLNWHDWFATSRSGVDKAQLMLDQNKLLRRNALGNFGTLLTRITTDPAMLLWLSGSENNKWEPNENYAREMMELFTLGAGRGYTEQDVREQARALTGWRNDWDDGIGPHRFRYDTKFHDSGAKRIFGKRGHFTWRDSVRLCLNHRSHPSFVVQKLWSYFIPTTPDAKTARALAAMYVRGKHQIRPLVEAILMHPDFYNGPRMVKPPVVYVAGLLRATGKGIDRDDWTWICDLAGQMLFRPPNVAGWDETRWLDTATFRGRWMAANTALEGLAIDPDKNPVASLSPAADAVDAAIQFWGNPSISETTRKALEKFAADAGAMADKKWKIGSYGVLRQNALRILVATSPDLQTC
ncbi:MAG: hypothetical protein QOJ29_1544 [Thermoleophilaceae bacterium]|nr:hypothetical protein [Thermoleophilaceae bacterium]